MAIRVGQTGWQFTYFTSGSVIYESAGVAWVVAPGSTEVSRNWYCRLDAATTAEANAACGDWFVPSVGQLMNPGYSCISYWDSYVASLYWSDSVPSAARAWVVNLSNGVHSRYHMTYSVNVRAFRCVTY